MKRLSLLFIILLSFGAVQAQKQRVLALASVSYRHRAGASAGMRISHTYNNVSLSEALLQLNNEQSDYAINFLYNELEDFRITTTIKNKKLPDAIRQMIGFYPIRVTVKSDDHEIYVECIHKTNQRLTGTIIDEQGRPVAYANVAILNPADSTLLSGGVSNESGYFVIPYEQPSVLVRISYVGYKTLYKLCKESEVGTVQMQSDNYTLNGVVVQGDRPKVVLQGNSLMMNVEGTVMERMGTAEDVLTRVPMIAKRGEGFEILGKGAPLIYLNNRKLNDLQELKNVQSDNIKNVEVIQNPGARYDASVNAVIIMLPMGLHIVVSILIKTTEGVVVANLIVETEAFFKERISRNSMLMVRDGPQRIGIYRLFKPVFVPILVIGSKEVGKEFQPACAVG